MTIKVLRQWKGEASEAERNSLELSAGKMVLRVKRLRCQDDGGISYERSALPLELFPDLDADRAVADSIVKLVGMQGLVLGIAAERLRIVTCTAEVAPHLGVPGGTPILEVERLVRTADGRPVEWRAICLLKP